MNSQNLLREVSLTLYMSNALEICWCESRINDQSSNWQRLIPREREGKADHRRALWKTIDVWLTSEGARRIALCTWLIILHWVGEPLCHPLFTCRLYYSYEQIYDFAFLVGEIEWTLPGNENLLFAFYDCRDCPPAQPIRHQRLGFEHRFLAKYELTFISISMETNLTRLRLSAVTSHPLPFPSEPSRKRDYFKRCSVKFKTMWTWILNLRTELDQMLRWGESRS